MSHNYPQRVPVLKSMPSKGSLFAYNRLSDEDLKDIFEWVDTIPFSRSRKNIAMNFADGILFGEAIHHFYPKMIDLRNYSAACSFERRKNNWDTLKSKVFGKIRLNLPEQHIKDICEGKKGAIEAALKKLYNLVQKHTDQKSDTDLGAGDSIILPIEGSENAGLVPEVSVSGGGNSLTFQQELLEKDKIIDDLKTTVSELQAKLERYETLVMLKDIKLEEMAVATIEDSQNSQDGDVMDDGTNLID